MITDEMMLHRMFVRYCNTHVVTVVSYRSKSSAMTIATTVENSVAVKVAKFKSIERFIIVIDQKNIMKLAFRVIAPIKFKNGKYNPSFLLETADGELEIVFRNS